MLRIKHKRFFHRATFTYNQMKMIIICKLKTLVWLETSKVYRTLVELGTLAQVVLGFWDTLNCHHLVTLTKQSKLYEIQQGCYVVWW